jgi:hypothetical protein
VLQWKERDLYRVWQVLLPNCGAVMQDVHCTGYTLVYNIDRRTELLVLKNVVLLQVLWKERDL